jgi:acetyl-CoA acyltransferase
MNSTSDTPAEAFICETVRTPIGRYGGALAGVRADDLAAIPIAALLKRQPALDPAAIEDVFLGCANQAGEDNRNVARMASLLAGLPTSVPGATINRLCGSGLDAVAAAARAIRTAELQLAIAGGVESMSRAPFVMPKADSAFSRNAEIFDTTIGWRFINPRLKERYGVDSMPETGENVAAQFNISRADQDRFALRSQQRAAQASARGFFASELVAVEIPQRKGKPPLVVARDEHPRPETTLEQLASLPTPFRANGTVTAGNASGVNDAAAAVVLADAQFAERRGHSPLGRLVAYSHAGVEPRIMGMGPVPAARKVLERAGLKLDDIDLFEVNEAFAAQALAVIRELGLPPERTNPNGSGVSLGHPIGATGAILAIKALYDLRRTGGRYALVTMCIGGGQGIAAIFERA